MQPTKWLLSVADHYESLMGEGSEDDEKEHDAAKGSEPEPTTDELRASIVSSCGDIPEPLKTFSLPAVICLSYLLKLKMEGADKILGHELIARLHLDSSDAFDYLQSLDELEQHDFVELIEDAASLTRMRPFCWLQSRIEPGDGFTAISTGGETGREGFNSNEEYLEAVVRYLDRWVQRTRAGIPPAADRSGDDFLQWESDAGYIEIQRQVERSGVPLPSAEIREACHLSEWQHLFLIGLLGQQEKTIEYDFRDMNDVVKLFVSGITARSLLREHLAGGKSPLVRQRLIQSSEGLFSTNIDLTPKALDLMLQRQRRGRSFAELRQSIIKQTLFGVEKPKVSSDALLLPPKIRDVLTAMLNAERGEGRKARIELQKNMPSTVGAPCGTTMLLYGPSGTGKTLTARYIASELKSILLTVDCSRIIDKYVGGSEKNVSRLFSDYRDICTTVRGTPVLLLNEADQLLSTRIESGDSVDRMNNNIQNLFLEALERFEGILVATTNLRRILDDAFSRRFTYKLEFPAPDEGLRRRLWESHLPVTITGDDVNFDLLASLDLTGGEIRLVVEQAVRAASCSGKKLLDGQLLLKLAQDEVAASGKKGKRGNIGFKADTASAA